jgi:zinc transport system substrate-binding protein
VAARVEDGVILDAHGIFQYFASGYGLDYVSDHLEARVMPSDAQWLELEETVKSHRILVMLWEEMPVEGIRNRLQEMGVPVSVFNPCANRPGEGSLIDIMNQNLKALEEALTRIES